LDHLSVQSHETVSKSSACYIVRVVVIECCISTSGCASSGHSQTSRENQIVGIRGDKPADRGHPPEAGVVCIGAFGPRRSCRYRSIPRIQTLGTKRHCLSSRSPGRSTDGRGNIEHLATVGGKTCYSWLCRSNCFPRAIIRVAHRSGSGGRLPGRGTK